MKQERTYLDMAKGLSVLFILWASARGVFSNYLQLFHFPFFFLLCGYTADQESDLPSFVKEKVHKIYIPYVVWNSLFMIGKALIRRSGRRELLLKIPEIFLLLEKDGEFFGASWTLAALFLVSCLYRFAEEFGHQDLRHHRILTLVFLFLAFTGLNFNMPFMLSRVTVMGAFYALGVQARYEGFDIEKHGKFNRALLAILIFAVFTVGNSVNLGANKYSNAGAFFVTSLSASYAVLYLCRKLEETEVSWLQGSKHILNYLSGRAVPLILWHFCGFWLAKLVQFKSTAQPFADLFKTAAIGSTENDWWLIYFAIGSAFALGWSELLKLGFWGKILKKLHLV